MKMTHSWKKCAHEKDPLKKKMHREELFDSWLYDRNKRGGETRVR